MTPIIVVGAGMIGAAAARHLAERGDDVVVVGATEPIDWTTADGPFASHYDAGRITRVVANDPVWSSLAAASLARYGDIERRSGIVFHDPVGLAWIGRGLGDEIADAAAHGSDCRSVDPGWLRATFGIAMPSLEGLDAAFEGPPAGLVNPRRLVAAELALAIAAGARHIPAAVSSLRRVAGGVEVVGAFGAIEGRAVLLATGAYGAGLAGVRLDVQPTLRTIVRVEIESAVSLPSVIAQEVSDARLEGIYWVPPVRYPDGRVLLKIGGQKPDAEITTDPERLRRWFGTDGDREEADALRATLGELLPDAHLGRSDSRPCVVTNTATGLPYLGWIDDRIAVAVGGNGAAAKSCDEIGRLAADIVASGENDAAGDVAKIDVVETTSRFAPQLA